MGQMRWVRSGQMVVGRILFDWSKTGRIMERQEEEEETAVGKFVPRAIQRTYVCLCCPENTWEPTATYTQPLFPLF